MTANEIQFKSEKLTCVDCGKVFNLVLEKLPFPGLNASPNRNDVKRVAARGMSGWFQRRWGMTSPGKVLYFGLKRRGFNTIQPALKFDANPVKSAKFNPRIEPKFNHPGMTGRLSTNPVSLRPLHRRVNLALKYLTR